MLFTNAALSVAAWMLLWSRPTAGQTSTTCNPLLAACPPDPALGKSINVDFTKGAVDSFTANGNPTYGADGVSFTVAKSGDSPTLISRFYIMFGKVSITMKAAPGAGIVSTLVLQSDDLDEIDLEWLGADNAEVQSNYFGKGDVTTYNRGAFHAAPNNQNQFVTYTVEWTADQIIWSVGGTVVRVLTPATADANQYPQTPMQVKFGSWSGGDPSNAPGTIQWARGPTDYSKGPFSMVVQSIAISDYSTGTQYTYSGSSGNWQDITAVNGKVNGNQGSSGTTVAVAAPSVTSASPSMPLGGFGGSTGNSAIQTGYPWVASATTLQTVAATSSVAGIPSGWTVSGSGKIVPISSAPQTSYPTPPSSSAPSPLPSSPPSSAAAPGQVGLETITTWDEQGFLTTITTAQGYATSKKCFDGQGFATACAATITPAPTATPATFVVAQNSGAGNAAAAAAPTANAAVPSTGNESIDLMLWCVVLALCGIAGAM